MNRLVRRSSATVPDVNEATLLGSTNDALDGLFRSSPAGTQPAGNLRGTVLLFPGRRISRPISTAAYWLLWQGKVFDTRSGTLKNKLSPLRLRAIKARVSFDDSWVDKEPCVLLDYSRTSTVAHMIRDEIRLVSPNLYLGVVWLWRRRVAWFTLRQPVS